MKSPEYDRLRYSPVIIKSSKNNLELNSLNSVNSWNNPTNNRIKELEMKYYMKNFQIAKSVHELKNVFITISSFIDSIHFSRRNSITSHHEDETNKSKETLVSQNSIFRTFTSFIQKNNEIQTDSQKIEFLKSLCDFGINLIADITTTCKNKDNDNDDNKIIQPFNLYDAIKFCVKIFQARCSFEHKGFDVKYNLAFPENTYIDNIDEVKLKQVLINILSNSFKFTLKGEISVNGYKIGDKIRISIQDTGVGFDVSEFTPLQPYKIYEKNQKYNKNGSGLGLCIISDILSNYNTNLNFDSQKGRWSKFWFDLEDSCKQDIKNIQNEKCEKTFLQKSPSKRKSAMVKMRNLYGEKMNNYKFLGIIKKKSLNNTTVLQDIEENLNDTSSRGQRRNSTKFLELIENDKKKTYFNKEENNKNNNITNSQILDKKNNDKYGININQIIKNNPPLTQVYKKVKSNARSHSGNSRNFHNNLNSESLSGKKIQKYLNKTQTKKNNFLNNVVQKNFIVNDINRRSNNKKNDKKNENNQNINDFLKMQTTTKLEKRRKKINDGNKNHLSANKTEHNINKSKQNNLVDICKLTKLNKLNINTHLSQKKYTVTKLKNNEPLSNNKPTQLSKPNDNSNNNNNNNNNNNFKNTIEDKFLKLEIYKSCNFNFIRSNFSSVLEPSKKICIPPMTLNKNQNEIIENPKITIIICDDDQFVALSERNAILEYFKKIKEIPPKIYMARNGIECLYMIYKSFAKNITISLVFIDENMPFLNGTNTCLVLKNSKEMNFIPICLLSGDGSSLRDEKCSADMILSKPLNKNELSNIFKKYLGNIVNINK